MERHNLVRTVRHLVDAGCWQEAVAVIEERWQCVGGLDPSELLLALHHLPSKALLAHPHLALLAPVTDAIDPGGMDEPMPVSPRPLESSSSTALLERLGRLTRRSQQSRASGRSVIAARLAQDARNALAESDPSAAIGYEPSLAVLFLQWGSSLEAGGFRSAAVEYERAYDIAHSKGISVVAARAASNSAWLHAEIGDTPVAGLWLARARALSEHGPHAAADLADAVLHIDRDDLPGAKALLDRAEKTGPGEHWAAALWVRSLLSHDIATAAITEAGVDRRLRRYPWLATDPGFNGRLVRAARARALVLRGRIDPDRDRYVELSLSDQVVDAALSYVQGNHERALDHSRPVTEEALEPRLQSNALLVHAAAALALRRKRTATSSFQRAEAIIQHYGLHANYQTISHADLDQLIALAGGRADAHRVHPARHDIPALSRRENDVLAMLATAHSMDEIAERLFISKNTLKTLTRRLYRRLGVNNRIEAVEHLRRPERG